MSLLEYLLRETEQVHGKIRRYTSPDELAFYPEDVPPLVLPPMTFPQVIFLALAVSALWLSRGVRTRGYIGDTMFAGPLHSLTNQCCAGAGTVLARSQCQWKDLIPVHRPPSAWHCPTRGRQQLRLERNV